MVKINNKQHVTKDGIVKNNPRPKDGQWAGVILQQLGGNRFIAMTGAKNFVRDDKTSTITFRIGRNAKNINYVKIVLNSMDLYDMYFYKVRNMDIKEVSRAMGVYNDQLQSVFTEHTGLYTSL